MRGKNEKRKELIYMFEKLEGVALKYEDLSRELMNPDAASDQKRFRASKRVFSSFSNSSGAEERNRDRGMS